MMHQRMWVAALGAMALSASVASEASAQYRVRYGYNYDAFDNEAVHIGISGGAAVPTGPYAERFNPGWNVDGNLAIPLDRRSPIWLQFDVGYSRFGVNSQTLNDFNVNTGFSSMLSGTANLVIGLTDDPRARVVPYLIGGGGVYSRYVELDNYQNSGVACDPFFGFCQSYNQTVPVLTRTETVGGLDGGAGLRFKMRRVNFYLEARYETAFTNTTNTAFVPIRFGIEF
ncbi:MAG TPA: hypothetical protein VK733_06410 [Gemmatimonadaceae bacterium]|nr:hypothetical protein [Gemmatimonadaceae bacterium]